MSRPIRRAAPALLVAGALALAGCGGSGITAAEIGLELEPLTNVNLAKQLPRIGQGSPPYGDSVEQVLEAEGVNGVWVVDAKPGSPAAEAGIGPGDLIVAVGETDVTDPADVDEALDDADAGSEVNVIGIYVASGDATQFLDTWSAEVELPGG